MRFLFVHKHLPGQFEHLIKVLLEDSRHEVVGITQDYNPQHHTLMGLRVETYAPARLVDQPLHGCLASAAEQIANGLAVAGLLSQLKDEGFVPDICFAHIGWGEATYFKDIYPAIPLVGYCEFYYHARGVDADFDPAFPISQHDVYSIRAANGPMLLGLVAMDAGITPTRWQKSLFPDVFQSKIEVIHEGIDTDRIKPDEGAVFSLPNGQRLSRQDRVVTYATRNLEPYRGFHIFARALERVCRQREDCHIVVAGGDDVAYSARVQGASYRQRAMQDLSYDSRRVHFVGKLTYADYLTLLKVSSAHVYLTVPFVLSWSLLEAMAAGCTVVASDTAPVREVIRHEDNGLLADFFSPAEIAAKVIRVLDNPHATHRLGVKARHDACRLFDVAEGIARYRQLILRLTSSEVLSL